MRIAWFMPVAAGSAIGRFGRSIVAELAARGHAVAVFPSDAEMPAAPIACVAPIRRVEPDRIHALDAEFDAVIYNFGDNYLLHGGMFDALEAAPGIGIFHDVSIVNLFAAYAHARGWSPAEMQHFVARYCGGAAAQRFGDWLGNATPIEDGDYIPLIAWLARKTWAAVAHSRSYVAALESACPGPVAAIPLAYRPEILPAPPAAQGKRGQDLVIVTVGHVNANKCSAEVIEAIAASPALRARTVYRLFGQCDEARHAQITALAAARGVRVEFADERDDAALARCYESADIVCALRRPILEGASASAIEGLLSGRPVVVADAGFYAELPDRHVVKVPASVPVPALTAALKRLAAKPAWRHACGLGARQWAWDFFAPARYCDALEAFLDTYIEAKPLLRLGARIGTAAAAFGFAADEPAIGSIAAAATRLFKGVPR
ncbi:MAG: glycosyltransferase family 4 protein [Rhodospirillaceae bacterium]|nr:glycosyltransferase family 4 protein [Rhodospirillaceae bacterium]